MSPVVENNQYQSLYQSYLVTHKKVYDLNQKLPGFKYKPRFKIRKSNLEQKLIPILPGQVFVGLNRIKTVLLHIMCPL